MVDTNNKGIYYVNPITWKIFKGNINIEKKEQVLEKLKEKLKKEIIGQEPMDIKLKKAADIVYEVISQDPFTKIPSDTRIPINFVSLSDHLVSTALISYGILNKIYSISKKVEFTRDENIDGNLKILESAVRLASYFHDISKPDIIKHYEKSKNKFFEIIGNVLKEKGIDEKIIECIGQAIENHHGKSLSNKFDGIIAFADKLSSSERTPPFDIIYWKFCIKKMGDAPQLFDLHKAVSVWENLENSKVPFQNILDIKNDKGFSVFPLDYENFTSMLINLGESLGIKGENCFFLLGGDIDSVKQFVSNSGKLKDLRGSSYILRKIDKEIREIFRKITIEDCLIYVGGGSFLSLIPNDGELKEKLIDNIKDAFSKNTNNQVSITVPEPIEISPIRLRFGRSEWNTFFDPINAKRNDLASTKELLNHYKKEWSKSRFGHLYRMLDVKIWKAKSMKINQSLNFGLDNRKFKICEGCFTDIAEVKDSEDNIYLCKTCRLKREESKNIKIDEDSFHYRLCRNYYNMDKINEILKIYPTSIDFLVNIDENNNKLISDLLGFLMIDGNNFGILIQSAGTISEYKTMSKELNIIMEDLFLKAIAESVSLQKGFDKIPVDIFYIGGDDIFCAINGYYVFDVIKKYYDLVYEEFKLRLEYSKEDLIGFGVGVLFAKEYYPIKLVYNETEDLLDLAKKESKKSSEPLPFFVQFHSQKNSGYNINGNYFDPRPLSIKDLESYINFIRLWKQHLSKSLIHSILSIHFMNGEMYNRAFIHYQAGRSKHNKQKSAILMDLLDSTKNTSLYTHINGNKIRYNGNLYYELFKILPD